MGSLFQLETFESVSKNRVVGAGTVVYVDKEKTVGASGITGDGNSVDAFRRTGADGVALIVSGVAQKV